jgi:hypothetical protein
MEVVGENARAMLVAIQDLESEDAIDTAIGMFDSAVSKDSRAHKSKVETPVIPGALSDAAQQERAALLATRKLSTGSCGLCNATQLNTATTAKVSNLTTALCVGPRRRRA